VRIAQIASPFIRVPPDGYGGTERVVAALADELVARGHDVTVFATADSWTSARLAYVYPWAQGTYDWLTDDIHVARAFLRSGDFDVIHNHTGPGIRYAAFVDTPTVTTLHNRVQGGLRRLCHMFPAELLTVSRAAQADDPSLTYLGFVHNGVDTRVLTWRENKEDFVLHLGVLCEDKGTDIAVRAAISAGQPIVLAGRVLAASAAYFAREIEPLLGHPLVDFVGEVGDSERARLLGAAKALVAPVRWPEPFGLVLAEALACGTPVVTTPRGAIPEIIEDGVTGFIVDVDEAKVAAALSRVRLIDPQHCRAVATTRFSVAAMTNAYESVYADLAR
jgi:glycosyltransferase involved in cell wall biosynthesis